MVDRFGLTPAVRALAQAAYDVDAMPACELDVQRLVILADALEEGGVAAELLEHLRVPGAHACGYWDVEAILGLG